MPTHRTKKLPGSFYVVDKRLAHEMPKLTGLAKWILSYMLSRPDDWEFRMSDVVQQIIDGERAIRTALQELQKHGLATSKRKYKNGKITNMQWDFYEHTDVRKNQTAKSDMREKSTNRLDVRETFVAKLDVKEKTDSGNGEIPMKKEQKNRLDVRETFVAKTALLTNNERTKNKRGCASEAQPGVSSPKGFGLVNLPKASKEASAISKILHEFVIKKKLNRHKAKSGDVVPVKPKLNIWDQFSQILIDDYGFQEVQSVVKWYTTGENYDGNYVPTIASMKTFQESYISVRKAMRKDKGIVNGSRKYHTEDAIR